MGWGGEKRCVGEWSELRFGRGMVMEHTSGPSVRRSKMDIVGCDLLFDILGR
jgi:hypothetical protein